MDLRASTHWPAAAGAIALALLAIACGGSTTQGTGSPNQASAPAPCDPLAPSPTRLETLIGVGKASDGTFYVADQQSTGQQRVFVSNGTTLVRKDVVGTGQMGGPPNASYTFSFRDPGTDATTARALLIDTSGGTATAMAIGPGNSKAFLGPGSTGDEPLTVVDPKTVTGLAVQDLPHVPMYVADGTDGTSVVVTWPMDAWGTGDAHLYYGKPDQMVERPITAYNEANSGDTLIDFDVDSANYTVHFSIDVTNTSVNPLGSPGPVTLDKGNGVDEMLTLRLPTPKTLSGFAFLCLAAGS